MPKFIITTHSTFENVYVVDADTREEAADLVNDGANDFDFYQKHVGEPIVDICTSQDSDETIQAKLVDDGFF